MNLTLTLVVAAAADGGPLQLSAVGEGSTLELAYCVAVQRLNAMLADAGVETELFEANGRYHRWDALAKAWTPVNDAELESIAVKSDAAARLAAVRALLSGAEHEGHCGASTGGSSRTAPGACDCGLTLILETLDGRGPNG